MSTPMIYMDCDVPEGTTLREWRRRPPARRPRWTARLAASLHRRR